MLGENTAEILAELGYNSQEIQELLRKGVGKQYEGK
jgi:crotonobetainyl-CoA:carnitine CoA-transferase CaiB-like acyl-CoA transferase